MPPALVSRTTLHSLPNYPDTPVLPVLWNPLVREQDLLALLDDQRRIGATALGRRGLEIVR